MSLRTASNKRLRDAPTILGERPIMVARELTKLHEEWVEGPAEKLAEHFAAPQGEFVVLVPPLDPQSSMPFRFVRRGRIRFIWSINQ